MWLTGAVVALGLLGALPRWPGIVQEVALPPLDLFADVRVLMAQSNGYPAFVVGLAAAVWIRAMVLAAILAPVAGSADRRGSRRLAVRFYAVAAVPAIPAAAFHFTSAAAVYHWDFWIGLGLTLVVFLVLAGAPVASVGGDGRRPTLRHGLRAVARRGLDVRVLLPYLVALVLVGAAGRALGGWLSVLLVPVSAAASRWAVLRLSRAGRRRGRTATVVGVVALVALVITMATGNAGVPSAGPPAESRSALLFVVPGVDTSSGHGAMFRLDPSRLGYGCGRVAYFSYAGPGTGAPQGEAPCPIRSGAPFVQRDTQRSLAELVRFFAREVAAASGGRPVVVITHSQAAWIAWDAVASGAAPQVRTLILLAPFPRVAVAYPVRGVSGSGRVGGDADRLLSAAGRRLGISTFSPDAPLAREILARAGAASAVFRRPLPPGVRAVAVFSAYDLGVTPQGWVIPGVPTDVVSATHRALPTSEDALGAANALLRGHPSSEGRLGRVLWPLLPAFGVPPSDT